MRSTPFALAALLGVAVSANADFLIETSIDGVDNDNVEIADPNFSFGGDTTNSGESIPSLALGITSAVSIFGGDGATLPDTYLYTYSPGIDGSNRNFAPGIAINDDGDFTSGLAAGISGTYRVYATWPKSGNNSGSTGASPGNTRYTIADTSGDLASVIVLQNEDVSSDPINVLTGAGDNAVLIPRGEPGLDGNQKGDEWEFLFEVALDAGETYTVTQSVTDTNLFVSQRSAGVLFILVPEPSTALLAALGVVGLAARRR